MNSILEDLRKFFFWSLDGVRGGMIKNHYNDIVHVLEGNNDLDIEKKIQARLSTLLDHSVTTTNFYSSRKGFRLLDDFPVVNKSVIRQSEADFLSRKYDVSDVVPTVTSGSTGTPFKVFHDRNKKLRNSADTLYFAGLAGFTVGDRLAYMKIWSDANKKSSFESWLQNVKALDVLKLDDQKIKEFIQELESDTSSYGFLAYASALELICKYLDRNSYGKVNASVKSVIAMSESLNDYTRITIPKYFGVPVVSRYSNLENGIIAQQEVNGLSRYLINTASYHVEILHMDRDVPVSDGEVGRIVVTDYFNFAMPMIRYDTGDIGSLSSENTTGRRYLDHVEGRKLDLLFDTKGNLISSFIVYKNMWQYTEILQYQLVQYGQRDYTLKITMDGEFLRERQLTEEFKSYLGEDANFKIEYVNDIPLLASGKRKKIMNTYHHQS